MKTVNYVIALFSLIVVLFGCEPKRLKIKDELVPTAYLNNPTDMTFVDTTYDFGTVNQGDKLTHEFSFTNTGTNDLLIADAKVGCGCTVPEYPKKPVKPGKSDKVRILFNTTNKKGKQVKTVSFIANTNKPVKLYIYADVKVDSTKL